MLSQYYEEHYAVELIGTQPEGVGYLLKERVGDVEAFTDAVKRVARGGSALDPEVVGRMLGRRASHGPLDELSPRERDVLAAMAEGKSNAGIAAALFVTEAAVEKHVTAIFRKLGITPTAPSTAACWRSSPTCTTAADDARPPALRDSHLGGLGRGRRSSSRRSPLALYPLQQVDPGVSSGVLYVLGVLGLSVTWGLRLGLVDVGRQRARRCGSSTRARPPASRRRGAGHRGDRRAARDRGRRRGDRRSRPHRAWTRRNGSRSRPSCVSVRSSAPAWRRWRRRAPACSPPADEERKRVVRDLHDGAQQRLVHTVIRLKLTQPRARARRRSRRARRWSTEALSHAESAVTELRELAHGILPAALAARRAAGRRSRRSPTACRSRSRSTSAKAAWHPRSRRPRTSWSPRR